MKNVAPLKKLIKAVVILYLYGSIMASFLHLFTFLID